MAGFSAVAAGMLLAVAALMASRPTLPPQLQQPPYAGSPWARRYSITLLLNAEAAGGALAEAIAKADATAEAKILLRGVAEIAVLDKTGGLLYASGLAGIEATARKPIPGLGYREIPVRIELSSDPACVASMMTYAGEAMRRRRR